MISHSPEATRAFACSIARKLKPGAVLALVGELGSGKTCFVQGLALGLRVVADEYVRSPTFTLIAEYRGRMPLYHIDLYRVERRGEVEDLGLEEYVDGRGVTAIEWADRFPEVIPARALRVRFTTVDETTREIVCDSA